MLEWQVKMKEVKVIVIKKKNLIEATTNIANTN